MKVMLLTPDRKDRPKMLGHCMDIVSNFPFIFNYELTDIKHLVINREPTGPNPDLTERIKEGYEIAVESGFDWVAVIENDDWYANNYLSILLENVNGSDFIGCEFTFYYNLKNKTWERFYHPLRSSLFQTAFRVSAMKNFKWERAHRLFLDIDLWKYARPFRKTFVKTFNNRPMAIGIKGHGEGMNGGKGHVMTFKNRDPDMTWLKSNVSEENFNFYKSL